jgi:acyl carrier protein
MDAELLAYIEQRTEVLDSVRRILVENLDVQVEPALIDPDTPLFGTGIALDSIDAVELVVSLEAEFDIQIRDVEMANVLTFRTLNTVVDLVLEERGVRL